MCVFNSIVFFSCLGNGIVERVASLVSPEYYTSYQYVFCGVCFPRRWDFVSTDFSFRIVGVVMCFESSL